MGIQRRNCEFAICSRLLRESVEVFGEHRGWFDASTSTWTGVAGPFFCGMSFRAVVPELAIALNGPTSTSKQLSVATRFGGDDGIILELNNRGAWHSEYARAFGCSWLSNFHAEDEWLFCGGRHRLESKAFAISKVKVTSRPFYAPFSFSMRCCAALKRIAARAPKFASRKRMCACSKRSFAIASKSRRTNSERTLIERLKRFALSDGEFECRFLSCTAPLNA